MITLPRWLWLPFSIGLAFFAVPLLGMLLEVPWAELVPLLTSPAASQALWLSLRTCSVATIVAVALGVPLAAVLARSTGWWVSPVRTLLLIPMVLPPVVAGLALLVTLGRNGPVGAVLSRLGIELGFSTMAVVIAQAFVAMPYLVLAVESAMRTAGTSFEQVAANLGASRAGCSGG